MLTKREAIDACLAFSGSYEDYPFDENWAVMRHQANKKIFAAVFSRQGKIWINVKADPNWADFWKSGFPAVVPAYHMNKRHWLSIILDGTMEEADILRLIGDSYDLTKPTIRRK